MKPTKHGNKWKVQYRVKGYDKPFKESFDTEEEAVLRCAIIELEKKRGTLKPPKKTKRNDNLTVSEFMDLYVERYGALKWGDSYYSTSVHRINDYIKPLIGDRIFKDLDAEDISEYYSDLLSYPAVRLAGHKDTGKTVSPSVIEKIHSLLRNAYKQGIAWGYAQNNPAADAVIPEYDQNKRVVWDRETAMLALSVCGDKLLKLCMMLSIGCSMRIGEILGLQWPEVKFKDNGLTTIKIKQELKRCDNKTLEKLEEKKRTKVFYRFPDLKVKSACKTVLVLKEPKTKSSCRTVFVPDTVAKFMKEIRQEQLEQMEHLHGLYQDYNMVIAQPNGRPVEERLIAKDFKSFILEHGFEEVVFHSLRHLSTSEKLKLSGGDIKAVQGDTGHAQAAMVTDVYAEIFDEDRKRLAVLMEKAFFSNGVTTPDDIEAKKDQVISAIAASPELLQLLLAISNNK